MVTRMLFRRLSLPIPCSSPSRPRTRAPFSTRRRRARAAASAAAVDGSLSSRAAVTLLAHGSSARGRAARRALGLAHLACGAADGASVASVVRLSWPEQGSLLHRPLRLPDAVLNRYPRRRGGRSRVVWHDTGLLEFFALDEMHRADAMLAAIQGFLLRRVRLGAERPSTSRGAATPPPHAWARLQRDRLGLLRRDGHLRGRSARAVKQYSIELDVLDNVLVRLVPRGEPVSPEASTACSSAMRRAGGRSAILRIQRGAASPGRLVHRSCCTRARCRRSRCTGRSVTLFAPGGVPGKPIREPGSCAWRMAAATVPLDATVTRRFDVMPCCARRSSRPSCRSRLQRRLPAVGPRSCCRGSSVGARAAAAAPRPPPPSTPPPAARASTRRASRSTTPWRTTPSLVRHRQRISEADLRKCTRTQPEARAVPLSDFFLRCSLEFGVATTLMHAFEHAGGVFREMDARRRRGADESARLRRVTTRRSRSRT